MNLVRGEKRKKKYKLEDRKTIKKEDTDFLVICILF